MGAQTLTGDILRMQVMATGVNQLVNGSYIVLIAVTSTCIMQSQSYQNIIKGRGRVILS